MSSLRTVFSGLVVYDMITGKVQAPNALIPPVYLFPSTTSNAGLIIDAVGIECNGLRVDVPVFCIPEVIAVLKSMIPPQLTKGS